MYHFLLKITPNFILKYYKLKRARNAFNTSSSEEMTHLAKQHLIYQSIKNFNKHKPISLIESGTFLGEMVSAQRLFFNKIVSIELSKKLASAAQNHFKQHKHIQIIQGDSAQVLPLILKDFQNHQVVFWLDGHYSGAQTAKGAKTSPIMEELNAIASILPKNYKILIDDMRLFHHDPDYPKYEDLILQINALFPSNQIKIIKDVMIIEPMDLV